MHYYLYNPYSTSWTPYLCLVYPRVPTLGSARLRVKRGSVLNQQVVVNLAKRRRYNSSLMYNTYLQKHFELINLLLVPYPLRAPDLLADFHPWPPNRHRCINLYYLYYTYSTLDTNKPPLPPGILKKVNYTYYLP